MITLEDKLQRYYKNLPSYLKPESNTNINALIRAWATSDVDIENNIDNAKEQIFIATATGIFLDRLASNFGIERPEGLSVDDDTFRAIIPILASGNIVTKGGISDLIDALFGEDAQRAFCISQNPETYRMVEDQDLTGNGTGVGTFEVDDITDLGVDFEIELESDTQDRLLVTITAITGSGPYTIEVDDGATDLSDFLTSENAFLRVGESLTIETDRGTEFIRFPSTAFSDHNAATAQELVDYYNAHMTYSYATVHSDTNINYFRIRTNTIGASGYIQVTGGTANGVLNFDTATRSQNASIIIVEPGNENEVIIEVRDDTTIVRRDLRGSWHLREDESIVDSRPTIDELNPFYPGAFLASPAENSFISSVSCTLQEEIFAGDFKNSIVVDDSSSFPNETGKITFSFGTDDEEGPIEYFGRPSNTSLILNPTREFTKNHGIGDIINISTVPDNGSTSDYGAGYNGYKPRDDGTDYMCFVTDPLTTSVVLEEILDGVTSAGIPLSVLTDTLVYKWEEL